MAYFKAFGPFTPASFDLNFMLKRTSDTRFEDNTNRIFDAVSYEDNFTYHWFGKMLTLSTYVAGTGLTFEQPGAMPLLKGGTITGLFEYSYKGVTPFLRYSLKDFTADAEDFVAASNTATRADDRAFFAAIFKGADTVDLSKFSDQFRGYGGNDTIIGRGGSDILSGNRGADRIDGGFGNDTLIGGFGNDRLNGNTGNDILRGGFNNDLMRGGLGADTLQGGGGRDRIFAGVDAAQDTFVYRKASDSLPGAARRDKLFQYDTGEDKIDMSFIDADVSQAGFQSLSLSYTGPKANSVWLAGSGAGMLVKGDVNGDTTADFVIQIVNLFSMDISDLVF